MNLQESFVKLGRSGKINIKLEQNIPCSQRSISKVLWQPSDILIRKLLVSGLYYILFVRRTQSGHRTGEGCFGHVVFLHALLLTKLLFGSFLCFLCTLHIDVFRTLCRIDQYRSTVIHDLCKSFGYNCCYPLAVRLTETQFSDLHCNDHVLMLNARQSRFVADLTHELKTPLTSLIGYADLLRGGTLDAERRRTAAEALYHESARPESLSQQLLALNGLQADGVVLRPVRVAAAFADAVRSLPDVVLDCDAPAEAVVLADRVLLADLVRNLALNAWHAGPQDGAVHLRCTDAGECWRLTVQDTGCGIPAEALPHLTEPFYRVDKARARANGGSGVGLALCAQIAEAFGTQLTFASRVGEGTTVTILLQKEAEHEEAAQQQ